MPKLIRRVVPLFALIVVGVVPAGAGAATIFNGDFETGDLSGWTVQRVANTGEGGWFAYSGTEPPLSYEKTGAQLPAPPQGHYAATTDEKSASAWAMFQDVGLEPGLIQKLHLIVYYNSPLAAIAVDPAEPLGKGAFNQWYRIDVLRQGAPVNSLAAGDVLETVFQTTPGAPKTMAPTSVEADLTPFDGQTVRIRLMVNAGGSYLYAGADAISLTSTAPPPPPPPSNAFTIGKLAKDKKKGTVTATLTVPGAGVVSVASATGKATTSAQGTKALLKPATKAAAAAGTIKIVIRASSAGMKALKKKGKLTTKAAFTFTPTGGRPSTQTKKITLVKSRPKM